MTRARATAAAFALIALAACDDGDGAAPAADLAVDAAALDLAVDAAALDQALDATSQDATLPDLALDLAVDAAPDLAPDLAVDAAVDYAIPDPPPLPERDACDDSRPPVVMAHGLLAAGDTWAAHVARFAANGHCPDRYHAFDWDTLAMDLDNAALLDVFVDAVRAEHGAERVDLMGHSAGGRLGYDYLADPARAAKVRRYVHTGSFPQEVPPGPAGAPVDTLNIWSDGDLIVPGADIPGAQNTMIPAIDHYAVATDAAAFEAVYAFLYDDPPATSARPAAEIPIIAGRVLTLGQNAVEVGATVDVWPLDPATGQRLGDAPRVRLITDAGGHYGPFAAERGVPYELHVRPDRDTRPVRYYRPPFTGDDPLVYLRTLPARGSVAGLLLTQVPFTAEATVLVVFSSTRALVAPGDTLLIDGEPTLTPALAPPEETLIALFVYDQGRDGQPGATNPLFEQFPFLQMLDRFIPADATESTTIRLGEQTLAVPRLPADPHGAVIAVFDPTAEVPAAR